MWGGRRSLEMFQLLPRTPALSAPPGEWPDSGAIGEGLGDEAPDPWGRRAGVFSGVPAVVLAHPTLSTLSPHPPCEWSEPGGGRCS